MWETLEDKGVDWLGWNGESMLGRRIEGDNIGRSVGCGPDQESPENLAKKFGFYDSGNVQQSIQPVSIHLWRLLSARPCTCSWLGLQR